jgi:hypothetical protein
MTIKALYPTVRPSLNLDFAKTKALDPRVTFSRASTGTFVGSNGLIQTAASGAARFDHNPATGESLGLLVEEARTNLVTYSEQFDNAAWTKVGATVTANAAVALDGNTTGDKLVEDTSNGQHYIRSGVVYLANSASTIYIKPAGRTRVNITAFGDPNTANFDLTGSGTVLSGPGSIQALPSGWYRCTVLTGATTSYAYLQITLINTGTNTSYTGDGTSGIFIWGAQVEAGAFPTSYIPTTTATVTRAADVASMTGTNFSSWYRQDEGTLLAIANAYNANAALTGGGFNPSVWGLSVNPGSNTTYASLWRSSANNNGEVFVRQSNVTQALLQPASTIAAGARFKQITALKQDNFASSNNGSSVAIDTSGTLPSFDQLVIGGNFAGGSGAWNSTVARLAYYPVRLPDAQLQALTAT